MNEPSAHNHTPVSASGRTASGPTSSAPPFEPLPSGAVPGPTPPPPFGTPPPQQPAGPGLETVEVLTKTVLPMLLGADGKMAKWLPLVAGGALLGAGLGYFFYRDQQRPRSTPRPLTQHVTTAGVPAPYAIAHAHAHPGPVMMTRVGPGEFPLGFVYESVPGKKRTAKGKQQRNIVDVTSRAQFIFRGEHLIIPSSIAQHFDVVDIKVAGRTQLVGSEALPAATFVENGVVSTRLRMETAVVAQDITLVVENLTPQDRRFSASLIGTVID